MDLSSLPFINLTVVFDDVRMRLENLLSSTHPSKLYVLETMQIILQEIGFRGGDNVIMCLI